MPSFDEVLASFRTPATIPGEEVGWPEEPARLSQFDDETLTSPVPSVSPSSYAAPMPDTAATSALEALMASIRQPSTPPPPAPLRPVEPVAPVPSAHEPHGTLSHRLKHGMTRRDWRFYLSSPEPGEDTPTGI